MKSYLDGYVEDGDENFLVNESNLGSEPESPSSRIENKSNLGKCPFSLKNEKKTIIQVISLSYRFLFKMQKISPKFNFNIVAGIVFNI